MPYSYDNITEGSFQNDNVATEISPDALPGNQAPVTVVPVDENGNDVAPDNQTPSANGGDANAPPALPPADPTAIDRNRANIENPTLPNGAKVTPELQEIDPALVGSKDANKLDKYKGLETYQVLDTQKAATPEKIEAATVDAHTVSGQTPTMTAEQQATLKDEAKVKAEQQDGLSDDLKSTLDNFNAELDAIGVDPNMTVQGQYTKLMEGFNNGGTPSWAQGAISAAEKRMAARGLGGSSMAAGAISSAVMQAAMPIAAQDAQVFKELKLTVLDKKAQGTFLRAGFIAQLDMTNLNNRQQAAVINAQSFLQLDMKNLDNRQQASIINTQARLQTLMSDQSAINSARQFNAKSANEVNTFYADLKSRTEQFNTNQTNEMSKFNVGETNASRRYEAGLNNQREIFNSQNATLIEQSNLNYQRGVATMNTAVKNQANMVNSQNLVNISNAAMGNEIQIWRDEAAFTFQAGENAKDRALAITTTQLQNQEWFKRYNTQQKDAFWSGVGNFVMNTAGNVIADFLDDADFGSGSGGGSGDEFTGDWTEG